MTLKLHFCGAPPAQRYSTVRVQHEVPRTATRSLRGRLTPCALRVSIQFCTVVYRRPTCILENLKLAKTGKPFFDPPIKLSRNSGFVTPLSIV